MTTDHLLRAELAGVSVSPDFASRVKARIAEDAAEPMSEADALSQELAGLSVSPAFAARVRQQIEETPVRSTLFGWLHQRWAVPSAMLAAAAVILLIFLLRPVAPGNVVEPIDTVAASSGSVVAPPSNVLEPRVLTPPIVLEPRVFRPVVPSASVKPAASDPMDEVITSQPAVLRKLWATSGPARELVEPNEVARPVASGEIVIAPIEVNPIVVKSLIDPDGSPSGSAPIIRRVAADQAERSPK